MRILFISNYYPPYEVGGYEQLCRDVAGRLAARGHSVATLTSDYGSEQDDPAKENGIYRRLKLRPAYHKFPSPAAEFFISRRANLKQNLHWLNLVLDEYRPDLVFIWNLQRLPRELAVACEERDDVAVAYWLAGYSPAEPDEFWLYWQNEPAGRLARLLKRPLRRVAMRSLSAEKHPLRPRMAHVAVVSHYMLEKGLADGSLPAGARVIYNGVEFESFFSPVRPRESGPLRILQAGRLSEDKGVHTSLEALNHLVKQGQGEQTQLLIAGSGPAAYEQKLRAFVADNGLGSLVTFLGWLPRERMPQLMADADVLLLPTPHPEPFARVVLEGMAAGLTVIGSTTGGTTELLKNGANGLTFEAGDSLELARQLATLIDDDSFRQRLARQGQQQVEQEYNIDLMVDRIELFLKEALEPR